MAASRQVHLSGGSQCISFDAPPWAVLSSVSLSVYVDLARLPRHGITTGLGGRD